MKKSLFHEEEEEEGHLGELDSNRVIARKSNQQPSSEQLQQLHFNYIQIINWLSVIGQQSLKSISRKLKSDHQL